MQEVSNDADPSATNKKIFIWNYRFSCSSLIEQNDSTAILCQRIVQFPCTSKKEIIFTHVYIEFFDCRICCVCQYNIERNFENYTISRS